MKRVDILQDPKATHYCKHCGLTMKAKAEIECPACDGDYCESVKRTMVKDAKADILRAERDELIAEMEFLKNDIREMFESENDYSKLVLLTLVRNRLREAVKFDATSEEDPWVEPLAGLAIRKKEGSELPDFTVGEEVHLLNPPLWGEGSTRVIITGMRLHPDGGIQCSWVTSNTSTGSAPAYSFRKIPSE